MLNPPRFIIQSNLNGDTQKIVDTCEELNYPYTLIKVIPFSDDLPYIEEPGPYIYLGSTTLINTAYNNDPSSVFFNSNFKPEYYAKFYSYDYLNVDQVIYKIGELPEDLYLADTEVFIRSNDDSKQIAGGTCKFSSLLDIKKNTQDYYVGGDIFSLDSEICINKVIDIHSEYRFVVINGVIRGQSMYRPHKSTEVPDDVLNFAKAIIKKWQPHELFVIDVALTDEGLKVIECNCLNASGWYLADYKAILTGIYDYVLGRDLDVYINNIKVGNLDTVTWKV